MYSVSGWLALTRWRNALLSAAGVVAGAWWAARAMDGKVWWAVAAAVLLTGTANAWNDADDVEIDRSGHPDRPIPQGLVTVAGARVFATVCAIGGVAAAWFAAPPLALVALAAVAVMASYGRWLKRWGALGNVVVAVVASLPFLFGAWAVDAPQSGVLLVLVAAPLHFAREVAKDLDDAHADAFHRRTLAHTFGPDRVWWVVAVAVALFVLALAPIIRLRSVFGLAILPAVVLAAAAVYTVFRRRRGSPALFKAAMAYAIGVLVALPR